MAVIAIRQKNDTKGMFVLLKTEINTDLLQGFGM